MKKSEIAVGRVYTDNKGGLRQVLAEGPQYKLYEGVNDLDCLRYKALAWKGPLASASENAESNSTRVSFAAWAKAEVPTAEVAAWLLSNNAALVARKLTAPQRNFLSTFDDDLNPTSLISVSREEFRLAKACRDKGLVAEMPGSLKADDHDFEMRFNELGIAVLALVFADQMA